MRVSYPCKYGETLSDKTFSSIYSVKQHADEHFTKCRWICQYHRCLAQIRGRKQLQVSALAHHKVRLQQGYLVEMKEQMGIRLTTATVTFNPPLLFHRGLLLSLKFTFSHPRIYLFSPIMPFRKLRMTPILQFEKKKKILILALNQQTTVMGCSRHRYPVASSYCT